MKNHRLLRLLALTLTLVLLLPMLPTVAGAEASQDEYVIQLIVSSAQTGFLRVCCKTQVIEPGLAPGFFLIVQPEVAAGPASTQYHYRAGQQITHPRALCGVL